MSLQVKLTSKDYADLYCQPFSFRKNIDLTKIGK